MVSAFSEMEVIQADDVSKQHYKEIKEWHKKYLSLTDLSINSNGLLQQTDKVKELSRLANELVCLCVEIIEHNAKNDTKKECL